MKYKLGIFINWIRWMWEIKNFASWQVGLISHDELDEDEFIIDAHLGPVFDEADKLRNDALIKSIIEYNKEILTDVVVK